MNPPFLKACRDLGEMIQSENLRAFHFHQTLNHSINMDQFTCITCQIALPSGDMQRTHYKSDWHRYNLKRKVAQLPPVSAQDFNQRIAQLQAQSREEAHAKAMKGKAKGKMNGLTCDTCKKAYSSQNAFDNHVLSKKHIEAVKFSQAAATEDDAPETDSEQAKQADLLNNHASAQDQIVDDRKEFLRLESQRTRSIQQQLAQATSESQIISLLELKHSTAPRLNPEQDCLFCPHMSESLSANLEHMAHAHSFFVPDLDYVTDLPGLLQELCDKVSVKNMCLWCNEKGKAFQSLESVRKHMLDKGHTKIDFEDEDAYEDLAEYYDFSSTWEDALGVEVDDGDSDFEDVSDSELMDDNGEGTTRQSNALILKGESIKDTAAGEWHLPNQKVLGHRSLHRYYQQRLPPSSTTEKESVQLARVALQYQTLGLQRGRVLQGLSIDKIRQRQERREMQRDMNRDHDKFDRAGVRVGVKSNRLQRYFRAQVEF